MIETQVNKLKRNVNETLPSIIFLCDINVEMDVAIVYHEIICSK